MSTVPFQCVIIDDNDVVVALLSKYIDQMDNLVLKASFEDGTSGLTFLAQNEQPDILFLDIELPDMNGLDLLRALQNKPDTVLITTHKDFALEAYDLGVMDYMVKPVAYPRFIQSVERVLNKKQPTEALSAVEEEEDSFFIKVNKKMVRVKKEEISFIEALSDYVIFNTLTDKHIVYSSLKNIDAKLRSEQFMRVHRSYIVNLHAIQEIEDNSVIIGKKYIPIGKSYQEEFFGRINKL